MIKIPYKISDPSKLPNTQFWFKVNITAHEGDLLYAKDFLKKYRDQIMMVSSISIFYELTALQANKGEAVKYIAEKHSCQDIYTIGDNFNDISMLKVATKSFAPLNAENEVKQVSNIVVSSNNKNAIKDVVDYIDYSH